MRIIIILLIALTSLLHAQENQESHSTPNISKEARAYMEHALQLMKKHSYMSDEIDWERIRNRMFAEADGAETYEDTYRAIRLGVYLMHDHHSFFMPPKNWKPETEADKGEKAEELADIPLPKAKIFDGKYAYLWVPGFRGSAFSEQATNYSDMLLLMIRTLKAYDTRGWIVDLRNNSGGNMWPMIAGLGPLLGDGKLGSFTLKGETISEWYYEDGVSKTKSGSSERVLATTTIEAPEIAEQELAMAILFGPRTASSGEAILVAFMSNRKNQTFGLPSVGVATGNKSYYMPDGAILVLASYRFSDRHGFEYKGNILPTFKVYYDVRKKEHGSEKDPVIEKAIEWIEEWHKLKEEKEQVSHPEK